MKIVQISFPVTEELRNELKKLASSRSKSMAEVGFIAIQEYIKNCDDK